MKKYILGFFLSLLLFPITNSFSQINFTVTPYITLPGNNYDYDILYSYINPLICWVNYDDSVYTLYLKQTSPDSVKNIAVYSDTLPIANPKIAFITENNNSSVRIIWQSFKNNHWQILSKEYEGDSLTIINAVTDSLTDNISPALSESYVFWIRDGNLVYHIINSSDAGFSVLDSGSCSNPEIVKNSNENPDIVYEEGMSGSKIIKSAFYSAYFTKWEIDTIAKNGNNINPRFGAGESNISYQEFENGVWKAVYALFKPDTTENLTYNCENPMNLTYPLMAKKADQITPYFVVYDSDSLLNNKEVFLKTGYEYDTAENISNAKGDDYFPTISFFNSNDTPYVAIFWIHEQNNKKDIWMGYSKYDPYSGGGVKDPDIQAVDFKLEQNYPNPFNPSTEISWNIAKGSPVTLKIYDILGNEITTLVNEYQLPGEHSVSFDTRQISGSKLSSGVYFYQLKASSNTLTKKMIYLK